MIEARADARRRAARWSRTRTGRSGRSTAAWPSSTRTACSTCRCRNLIGAHQVGERRHRARRAARPRLRTRPPAPPPSPAPNGRPACSACAAARWSRPPAAPSSGSTAATTPPPARRSPRRSPACRRGRSTSSPACSAPRTPPASSARSPPLARSLHAVTIPGEAATLTAEETVAAARAAGFAAASAAAGRRRRRRRHRRRRPRRPHPDLRLALPRRPGAARERLTRAPSSRQRRFTSRGRTRASAPAAAG